MMANIKKRTAQDGQISFRVKVRLKDFPHTNRHFSTINRCSKMGTENRKLKLLYVKDGILEPLRPNAIPWRKPLTILYSESITCSHQKRKKPINLIARVERNIRPLFTC